MTGKEIPELDDTARRVHVLVGRDPGYGGFVHADGLGDVPKHHGAHELLAAVEKVRLAPDNGLGHLQQRFVANLEAADEPSRLLQLGAQHAVPVSAAQGAGIGLVHAQPRCDGRVQLDDPLPVAAAHEDIRNRVLGGGRVDRRSGTRMACAHQQQRLFHILPGCLQEPRQRVRPTFRDQFQVFGGDGPRKPEAGGGRIELRQLQEHGFADGAGADARRVQVLNEPDRRLDLLLRSHHVRRQRRLDGQGVIGEIAIVVDGVDDGLADRGGARVQIFKLQLPEQVAPQRLVGAVGVVERALRRRVGGRVARSGGFGPLAHGIVVR